MATGTTNPMTYTSTPVDHNGLTGRDAAEQHPISSITGLSAELTSLREQCGSALREALRSFIDSYTAGQETAVSQETINEINSRLDQITLVVETWNTENEDSTLEKLIKDVSDLQLKVGDLPALLIGLSESNLSAAKAVESMTTDLADFRTKLDNLTVAGSDSSEQMTTMLETISGLEAGIGTLEESSIGQTAKIQALINLAEEQLCTTNLTVEDTVMTKNAGGSIKQRLDQEIPKELVIEKVEAEAAGTGGTEGAEADTRLDYKLTFKNSLAEEGTDVAFTATLPLTEDINNYLTDKFGQFDKTSIADELTSLRSSLNTAFSRLTSQGLTLTELVSAVACINAHHRLAIRKAGIYFADGANHIGPFSKDPEQLVNVATNFFDSADFESARVDNKVFTPSQLAGRRFFVVLETSYPISLKEQDISLGFPNFVDGSTIVTADDEGFGCTVLGSPTLNRCIYLIHATVDDYINEAPEGTPNPSTPEVVATGEEPAIPDPVPTIPSEAPESEYFTPFVFGDPLSVFGTLFTEESTGTDSFMIKVTDPYNATVNVIKEIKMTTGYPIYCGISVNDTIDSLEDFTMYDILHTLNNSPAATIDWATFNEQEGNYYYYYLVPKQVLDSFGTNKTIAFMTNFGPGGWEYIDLPPFVSINGQDYLVFRTSYKLSACTPTTTTVVNK